MAILKDSVVSGNLRVTDTILTETIETDTIKARASSSSTTMSTGTAGQGLRTDGTNVYWADTADSDTNVTQTVTTSSNVSFRPLLLGASYSDASTFAPDTTTSTAYATHLAKFKPSTGVLSVVGLNKMNSDATIATGSNTTVWNTNGGTTSLNSYLTSQDHYKTSPTAGTYKSVTVDANGHITAGTNPTTLSGYGITNGVVGNSKIFFGTTDTAAGTGTKVVTCSGFTSSDLAEGTVMFIKFATANSAAVADLYLNINDTGAVRIRKIYNTGVDTLNAAGELRGVVNEFIYYDAGTPTWLLVGVNYDTNTTYSEMSQSVLDTGTSTTAYRVSPKLLRDNFYTETEVNALIPDAVEANPTVPSGTTPTSLSGLKVGSSYYSVASGGGTITDVTVNGSSVVSSGVAAVTVPTISTNVITDKLSNAKTVSPKAVYDEAHPEIEYQEPIGGFLPNKLYVLGEITGNETWGLNTTDIDVNVLNHYYWTFNTPSNGAPHITWPYGVKWGGNYGPIIYAGKHYEVSIINNYGMCLEI